MLDLYTRVRKGKDGERHSLMALTRDDQDLIKEIERQKHLVKSGAQEAYELTAFQSYVDVLVKIAAICRAITAPPSEQPYNLALAIGKEVSRLSGVDFVTCFTATSKKRKHISQHLHGYEQEQYRPILKPHGLTILLVDDVIYTGYTLIETKRSLESLGNFIIPIALTYS